MCICMFMSKAGLVAGDNDIGSEGTWNPMSQRKWCFCVWLPCFPEACSVTFSCKLLVANHYKISSEIEQSWGPWCLVRERALPVVLTVASHLLADYLPSVFSAGEFRDAGPRLFSLHRSHIAHTLSTCLPVKVLWSFLDVAFAVAWVLRADGTIHKCFLLPLWGNLLTLSGPYEPIKTGAACDHMPHKQYGA